MNLLHTLLMITIAATPRDKLWLRSLAQEIENQPAAAIIVAPLKEGNFQLWKEARADAVLLAAHTKERLWNGYLESRPVKEAIQVLSGVGPSVQRLYWLEARRLKKLAEEERARELLLRAVRMHPDLEVQGITTFDDIDSENATSRWISSEITRFQLQARKRCRLQFTHAEEGMRLSLNRFRIDHSQRQELITNQRYLLELEFRGGLFSQWMQCRTGGLETIDLSRLGNQDRLVALFSNEKDTTLIFERGKNGIRLSLRYPSGKMLDLGQKAVYPMESEMRALADRIRTRIVDLETQTQRNSEVVISQPQEHRWYNDWEFWSVAAFFLGGGIAIRAIH